MNSFNKFEKLKFELKEYSKDLTILIVEDDKTVNEMLSNSLSKFFKQVYFATDGLMGLEMFRQNQHIDIVISDVMMPLINGIEMVESIKNINPNIKVILISANNETNNLIKAISVGIEYFILKPVVMHSLKEILLKVTKRVVIEKEHEKNRQINERKEKLARMGELISSIAHQWKQPLNALNTELLKLTYESEINQNVDSQTIKESIKKMNRYSQKMSQTVMNFINFTKPEFRKEWFSLKSVIDDLEIFFKEQFVKSNIKLIIEIDESIEIFGFRGDLLDMLMTIISNSKDAIIENKTNFAFVKIGSKVNSENITIFVDDNGGGIKKEIEDRVFEPYFTTKDESLKSGLGLYIVHSMCSVNFNGEMTFENRENDGVRFDIILPKIKKDKDANIPNSNK